MKDFDKEDIILEDGEIVNFKNLKKIANSGIEKIICKILIEEELKSGTGFFFFFWENNMKVMITNNHVINDEYLRNKKEIKIEIGEEKKEINLELKRYKMTNEEFDFTIIEIIKEDNINNYLEIDENIYKKDYINEIVFSGQYPGGDELNYSHGRIKEKKHSFYLYTLGTLGGSSGCPIILFNNLKVIGLHKGCIYGKNKNKINIGIPIYIIINIIIGSKNSIKCIYEIKNINVEIQILNNGYIDDDKGFIVKNEEIRDKIEIIINGEIKSNIMKYKFDKEGNYIIYIKTKERLINMSYMFNGCNSLISIDLSKFNTNNVTDMSSCYSLKSIDLSKFNTNNVTDMSRMFSNCISLESIDLSKFNTNNVTNMHGIFFNCKSLKSIDLSKFNTNNVTDMSLMFYNCKSIKSIDLSNFNTNNVTDMPWMFTYCLSLESIDLSKFNTNNVTDMCRMFHDCKSIISIDLSNFTTDNVTNMSCMFYYCKSLKSIDLSNFNTNNVTDVSGMFDKINKECKIICNDEKIKNERKSFCFIF